MKIGIASDHAGFVIKEQLKDWLTQKGFTIEDFGTDSEESCDYPDFAIPLAKQVSQRELERGILICGTGIGMSIAANKFKNVRAAVVYNKFSAEVAKEHNNANIVSVGSRTLSYDQIVEIISAWLFTKYEGGRHQIRIDKITEIES